MEPTAEELLSFLKSINNDFNPPLTNKVNLCDYVDKIKKKAKLVYYRSTNDKLVGLVVMYCNNEIEFKSYISLVGVLREYRGGGIARKMLKESIDFVKKKHYRVIGIHSNNSKAINLYKNLGFRIKEEGTRVYMELNLSNHE